MANGNGLHLVLLPWVGFSHIQPFLELSQRIAQLGHQVSLLSTPTHVQNLCLAHPDLPPNLHLVPLTIPPSDPTRQVSDQRSVDSLREPFAGFLRTSSPPADWVLFDFFFFWAPPIAAGLGVPCALVSLINAAANAVTWPAFKLAAEAGAGSSDRVRPDHLTTPPDGAAFRSSVAYRPHEARLVVRDVFEPTDGSGGVPGSLRVAASIKECHVAAVRSCTELEPEWLGLLGQLYGKPVLPLGHFPPSAGEEGAVAGEKGTTRGDHVFEWLGAREAGSVVYVAFGSEMLMTREQAHEVAHGLELSDLPFVWALRGAEAKPDGPSQGLLPPGFEDLTRARGLVCKGWVPQAKILGHPSVGGFMTHCGWNSIVESLRFGLVLVLLPMFYDQGINARLMEEKKVGVEVPRNEEDGAFTGADIARTLRLAMVEAEGEEYRGGARAMKGALGSKELHEKYVRNFIAYLGDNRSTAKPSIEG